MTKNMADIYKTKSTVFTARELAAIWEISNLDYLKTKIQYYIKQGHLYRVYHGLYAKDKNSFSVEESANKLRTPSYISFETVLFREGVIFQKPGAVFLASYGSRTVQGSFGELVYRKVKQDILFAKEGIVNAGTYNVATVERAFLDMSYLFKDYYFDNLRGINWDKVESLLPVYKSQALIRRVKGYKKDAQSK